MSQQDRDGVPSNHDLAQRTARIEERVEHVADTVDRIEQSVVEDQVELEEQVDENADKIGDLYPAYRFARWAVPISVAAAGAVASMGAAGVL